MGKHKLSTDNFLVLPTAVMHEQLACLASYGAVLFWLHTLAALFLCLLIWAHPPFSAGLLIAWLLIISLLTASCWWTSSHFHIDKISEDNLLTRTQRYVLLSTLLHALWGASGILLFANQIEVSAVHSALLLLISLGALPMLLLSWPIASIQIAAVLLPMALMLLWPSEPIFRLLSLVLIAAAIVTMLASRPLAQLMSNFQLAQRKLLEQMNTDVLTQLANRRQFEQLFKLEWRRSARTREPLALLMLGIDQAIHVNTNEQCLIALADYLKGAVQRAGDLVARYDDQRFIVLLPTTDPEEAAQLAEKFRSEIERKQLTCAQLAGLKVSIGAASCQPQVTREQAQIEQDQHDVTYPAHLLAAAEQALYKAQHGGGNQVILENV
ncbi:GGDEF domain-containing protein [uncultured Thiothrix sp.]|jgi:diguanylate cyclase (GGDEF)-like protein|uniref:GGDEF domain-containing protein n=1 Tax=uncultured Thiothrix sp. TaxID=223185 RepID=UPI002636298C|nr:GGDEF domain-containing protein [uncultured Thiothrix sp.]HMT92437.1 GGDEF domain-containing protein [Thiolinea sp.]